MLVTDSVTAAGIPMALARCVMLHADAVNPMKVTLDLVDEGLRFAFQVSSFFFVILYNCLAPGNLLTLVVFLRSPSSTI